jgi:hypothetical protein
MALPELVEVKARTGGEGEGGVPRLTKLDKRKRRAREGQDTGGRNRLGWCGMRDVGEGGLRAMKSRGVGDEGPFPPATFSRSFPPSPLSAHRFIPKPPSLPVLARTSF